MLIEIQKTHPSNGKKRVTICDYGYFLKPGKWEVIVVNLKPFKKSFWIWRKKSFKNNWPVCC